MADRARLAGGAARPRRRAAASTSGSGVYIVLGTIPIGIFGLVFSDQIENGARDLTLIGCTLIALGLLLLAAEQAGSHSRGLDDLHGARRRRHRLRPGLRRSCRASRARAPR